VIIAPDGSTATYDALRTREIYADPALWDDCLCPGCRNYRAAWDPDYLEPTLLDACRQIGKDPVKAFETVVIDAEDRSALYTGEFPFYGEIQKEADLFKSSFWSFRPFPSGTANFANRLSVIGFSVELPWILPEENPYFEH
jgi:hypothetical protein